MGRDYSEPNDVDADKYTDDQFRDDMPERDPDDIRDALYDGDLMQDIAAANTRSALFQQVSQIARDAVAVAQATVIDHDKRGRE